MKKTRTGRKPTVSVFIPVKNAKETIEKCINSVLNQSYKPEKIYVIDNMSTDGTYEILKRFDKKIHLEKMAGKLDEGSVPKMHNHILDHVKTEFLAYTNSDCVVDENWLKNLLSGFTSDDIVATAGYFGTPKGLGKLPTLIGLEMEDRFKNFPKYITRAPDANLCVRTCVAKKVRFDENFPWSWESDFGYRLTKLGKMKYIPKAMVYHYHRSTWKGFFKQQFNNAKIKLLLYSKHRDKILGDHISTRSIEFSLLLGYVIFLSIFLSVFNTKFLYLFLFSSIGITILFIKDMMKFFKELPDIIYLFGIYSVRLVAWMVGIPYGIVYLLKKRKHR